MCKETQEFQEELEMVMEKIPLSLLHSKNGVTEILFFTQFLTDPPSLEKRKKIVKAAFQNERKRRQEQCTPSKT